MMNSPAKFLQKEAAEQGQEKYLSDFPFSSAIEIISSYLYSAPHTVHLNPPNVFFLSAPAQYMQYSNSTKRVPLKATPLLDWDQEQYIREKHRIQFLSRCPES